MKRFFTCLALVFVSLFLISSAQAMEPGPPVENAPTAFDLMMEPFRNLPPPVDSDGDGVPEDQDKCPTVAAKTADGCPLTTLQPTVNQAITQTVQPSATTAVEQAIKAPLENPCVEDLTKCEKNFCYIKHDLQSPHSKEETYCENLVKSYRNNPRYEEFYGLSDSYTCRWNPAIPLPPRCSEGAHVLPGNNRLTYKCDFYPNAATGLCECAEGFVLLDDGCPKEGEAPSFAHYGCQLSISQNICTAPNAKRIPIWWLVQHDEICCGVRSYVEFRDVSSLYKELPAQQESPVLFRDFFK